MNVTCDRDETRAIAIAGLSAGFAMASMLKRMRVLDAEAIDHVFEAALSSVENAFRPDDPSAALARQLLDLMGGQLAMHVKPVDRAPKSDEARPGSHPSARLLQRRAPSGGRSSARKTSQNKAA